MTGPQFNTLILPINLIMLLLNY